MDAMARVIKLSMVVKIVINLLVKIQNLLMMLSSFAKMKEEI
jgi:hypothetical protein